MKQSFINRQKRQAAQRAHQRDVDAQTHMYYMVTEMGAEAYEQSKEYAPVCAFQGKFYFIVATQQGHAAGFGFIAHSRNISDYKIIHTVGIKTPIKKGEFVD